MSLIEVKINKSDKDLTINEIFTYSTELEKIMDIYTGAVSVSDSSPGCLMITVVIPLYCSLHAYKMAKKRIFKFRQYYIQYLQFETLPALFAFQFKNEDNPFEILSSNTLTCKFSLYTYV